MSAVSVRENKCGLQAVGGEGVLTLVHSAYLGDDRR